MILLQHRPNLWARHPFHRGLALPAGFLARAPRLQHLVLSLCLDAQATGLAGVPADCLARAPRLETFDLDLNVYARPRLLRDKGGPAVRVSTLLPAGFLARAPRLKAFDLDLAVHAPNLFLDDKDDPKEPFLYSWDDVSARSRAWLALPDRVLAYAPALETFALDAPRLAAVGDDFLARADRLQTLTLRTHHRIEHAYGADHAHKRALNRPIGAGGLSWRGPRAFADPLSALPPRDIGGHRQASQEAMIHNVLTLYMLYI